MKKLLFSSLGLSAISVFSNLYAGTLVGYDIPTSTTNRTVSPFVLGTGVSASSVTAASGLSLTTNNTSGSRWQATSYNQTAQTDVALDAANTAGDYWDFSITATTGYNLTVNGIGSFQWGASTSGPKNVALLYSSNATFNPYTIVVKSQFGANGNTNLTSDWNAALAAAPIAIAEGSTAYFRIVGYGASSNTGTGGMLGNITAPDFSVLGDALSTSPLFSWTGGAGNWEVGTAANWQVGGVSSAWQSNKDASFAAGGDLTIASGGVNAKAVSIAGSSPVSWGGGSVTATSLTLGSGASLTLNASVTNDIGTLDLTDASVSGGNLKATLFSITIGTGSQTISTVLSGTGALAKLGAGELVLSAVTAYEGQTSVGAGTLTTGISEVFSDTVTLKVDNLATLKLGGNETVGGLNAVYGSFINLQGNTLTAGGNGSSLTNGATITGTGSLVKNGTGQMYLNNSTNSFSGGFVLNDGSVAFTSSGTVTAGVLVSSVFGAGPLSLNGGIVTSSSSGSGRNIHNNIFLNGDVQFGTTSWGTTNVTLNTSTSIDTSKTSNNVTFPQSPVITVSTNANGVTTLQKDLTISTIAYVDWYQPISGNYRITKSGTGAYTLSNNFLTLRASNSFAGMTIASGMVSYKNRYAFGSGTLVLKDGAVIGQEGTINNTPLTGDDQVDRAIPNDISIEGNVGFGTGATANHLGGNINLNGGDRTITVINTSYLYGSVSNGALTVFDTSPSRTLYLVASNSYEGGTTHNGGILSVGNDNALGSGGLTVLSNKPYTNVSTNISATVITSVVGGVTNKTTNYTSTNYVTNVTVASNRLTMNTNSLSRTLTNGITLASGALYNIEIPQIFTTTNDPGTGLTITNNTNTYSMLHKGPINGAGSILKSGGGTLTLAGALSYSGSTTVTGGELRVEKTNLTTSITPANVTFIFSNNATTGTNQALPGALGGSYLASNITYSNLPSSLGASFDANAGTVVVTNAPPPAPANLSYGSTELSATYGALMTTLTPTCDNSPTSYSINPALPDGLIFSLVDGSIGGTPTAASSRSLYTVTATNSGGSTSRAIYLTVAKATPSITVAPTATAINSGQALSSSTLSGGTGSVAGTFAWTDSTITPAVGTSSQSVTFTPTDTANYNTATTNVNVTVNSSGANPESAYPGKNLSDVAPNGLTYLVNYAFGGNSSNAPKMPSQDVSDPTKLSLVAYVRTNDSGVGGVLSVKGQTNNSLSGWSTNTFGPSSIPADQSDAPAGTQKQIFSVPNTGDRLFLRLKVTK